MLIPGFSFVTATGETTKFDALAEGWWDPHGPFRVLHQINPLRLAYIRQQVDRYRANQPYDWPVYDGLAPEENPTKASAISPSLPFAGLRILDVGCGGGLLSEPMARLGATVTGIDQSASSIAIARAHAQSTGLQIDYRITSSIETLTESESFHVITALEVLEHVSDPDLFIQGLVNVLRPGGLLFFSTLNRTVKSYVLGIIAAEYITRWVPRGTHSWTSFIRPHRLVSMMERQGMQTQHMAGLNFNIMQREWRITDDLSVNYMGYGIKKGA